MDPRKGEKLGWILGWSGSFLWVAIIGIVLLFHGKLFSGALGILLWGSGMGATLYFAPWRFPNTRYYLLMAVLYSAIFISVVWAIWAFNAFSSVRLSLFWWLPLLILPLFNVGKRTWNKS